MTPVSSEVILKMRKMFSKAAEYVASLGTNILSGTAMGSRRA